MRYSTVEHFFILTRIFSSCPFYSFIERIQQHNSQVPPPTFTLGHNAYSDMTESEFAEYFKLGKFSDAVQIETFQERLSAQDEATAAEARRALREQVSLPDYVDWRASGAVTPIKNQGAW